MNTLFSNKKQNVIYSSKIQKTSLISFCWLSLLKTTSSNSSLANYKLKSKKEKLKVAIKKCKYIKLLVCLNERLQHFFKIYKKII